jgi:type 2 lantibiotic biosynthesis protein LanM
MRASRRNRFMSFCQWRLAILLVRVRRVKSIRYKAAVRSSACSPAHLLRTATCNEDFAHSCTNRRAGTVVPSFIRDASQNGGCMNTRVAQRIRSLVRTMPLEARIDLLDRSSRRPSGRKAAQARKAIGRWKKRASFKDGAFASWLARYGIDERQLIALMPPARTASVREHVARQPLWREFEILQAPSSSSCAYVPPWEGHEALLHLVQPHIARQLERIRRELESLYAHSGAGLLDLDLALRQATRDICREALYLIQKTCLLELRVAAVRGELAGEDGAARYRAFVMRLSTAAGREALFREYPLLLDVVVTRLGMYRRNIVQFLTDLASDAQVIARDLRAGAPLGKLASWAGGAGDSHRGGRAVMTLAFDDGTRLVYKPRALRIDEGFNRLVDWCNTRLPECPLRAARVLDRGTHGWCEFIEHRELESQAQAADFFRRQGKFMALFYALHAGDLHFENMIASGEDPVYIDLETLFHAQSFSPADGERHGWPLTVADTMIVSGSHTIPGVTPSKPDFSVFGAKPGQDMSVRGLKLARIGTDDACFEAADVALGERRHVPMLDGKAVASEHYVPLVMRGFREMYELLQTHAPFLVSEHGISAFFAGSETRIVFRSTQAYSAIIDTSLHPDYLSDALERRLFLEQLYVSDSDSLWRNELLSAETAEMARLDVPHFSIRFEDNSVRDASDTPIAGFTWRSPREVVSEQLTSLTASDLEGQLAIIAASLVPVVEVPDEAVDSTRFYARRAAGEAATANVADRVAASIAERFVASCIARRGERYWLCKSQADERLATSPAILNLYDGQLGIALFLAWAARVLERDEYAVLAVESLRTVQKWTQRGRRHLPNVGPFTGALGMPYALASMGRALDRAELIDEAVDWLVDFDPQRHPRGLDVIEGAAGGVLCISSIARHVMRPASGALHAAHRLIEHFADRIVDASIPQTVGVGWAPAPPQLQPLTGFGHGATGYAAALYTAASWCNKPAYTQTARAALHYENALFCTELGIWPDLRVRGPANHGRAHTHMSAWCSGSPGILLGRLSCLEAAGRDHADHRLLLDATASAARVARVEHHATSDGNLSLCHGRLGNLEILARAARNPDLATLVRADVSHDWLADERIVWRCGDEYRSPIESATATPGLLNGLAGIGYGLLRLRAPEQVPSVLSLEIVPQ